MTGLRTEFEFTLPKGYVASDGSLHRHGVMRLATARDEIEPLRDRSIDGPDDPYLTILVLARVITQLGSLPSIGVREVEGLFAADLAFLQDLYGIINFGDQADVEALQTSVLGEGSELAELPDEPVDDMPSVAAEPPAPESPEAASPDGEAVVTPRRTGRIEEVTRAGAE